MGWLAQQGTPSNAAIIWPTRVPGRGSSAADINPKTRQAHSGMPTALVVTDWVGCTGGKLEFYTGSTPALYYTVHVRFDGDPPYLPFRMEIEDEGLPMPEPWAIRMVCSLGQFDAMLLFRDA